MTEQKNKRVSFYAVMNAVSVSSFITSIAGLLPFGLAYMLPEGILRNIAFVISGIVCVAFFIGFSIHAYGVEMEMMFPAESGESEWDDHEA